MIHTQNRRLLNAVLKISWNNKSVKSRWFRDCYCGAR